MRIIKQGKPIKKDVQIATCPRCEAEIEFTAYDYSAIYSTFLKTLILECPCCGYPIDPNPRPVFKIPKDYYGQRK